MLSKPYNIFLNIYDAHKAQKHLFCKTMAIKAYLSAKHSLI